jgi:hypothetical protein
MTGASGHDGRAKISDCQPAVGKVERKFHKAVEIGSRTGILPQLHVVCAIQLATTRVS